MAPLWGGCAQPGLQMTGGKGRQVSEKLLYPWEDRASALPKSGGLILESCPARAASWGTRSSDRSASTRSQSGDSGRSPGQW